MDLSLLWLRVRKIVAALTTPSYAKALRRGVAASVEHEAVFSDPAHDFDFIVDVGANKGQFAVFARERFPKARIICFEPLGKPSDVLGTVFSGDFRVRLTRAAIAPRNERRLINVTEHDDLSSLLEVGELQAAAFGTRKVGVEEIECGPLSNFITECELGKRNLLKIDVQGFELEVLQACNAYLDQIQVVYCEVSYLPLYKGQACAGDVIAYLHGRGFRLGGVYNQKCLSNGPALQADMIFIKEASSLRNAPAVQ